LSAGKKRDIIGDKGRADSKAEVTLAAIEAQEADPQLAAALKNTIRTTPDRQIHEGQRVQPSSDWTMDLSGKKSSNAARQC